MIRKLIILVIGLTVVLIGLAMIALPGPAIIVIPAGLAILGTEFVWARRLLQKMKDEASKVSSRVMGKARAPAQQQEPHEQAN